MINIKELEQIMPVAPLKIAVMESCMELGRKVNEFIVSFRKDTVSQAKPSVRNDGSAACNYLLDFKCPRMYSGEGKGIINETVRGTDLFIMTDVCNYSIPYNFRGEINYMSPDDHFQDLKRVISAATGKARRISVIMPFMYESRQHKRKNRESLDCAASLDELAAMGVSNIITFDAHDPRVQNAIPLCGFDSFDPPYQFMKALLRSVPDLKIDKDHLMVISPDEGAMQRAVFLSGVLGVGMGMFYKRRDYSKIVDGKNPIVAHEFLGDDLNGKDVIVVDDMISSGGSMLKAAKHLKQRHAGRIILCVTFGLFTDGFSKFDKYYEDGYIYRVITTNLTYIPPEAFTRPYFVAADMSKFIAFIIDAINHDFPVSKVIDPAEKIRILLEKRNSGA